MRGFDNLLQDKKAHFGVGDFNLAVSTMSGAGHTVMSEISTPSVMRFLPALEYTAREVRVECALSRHRPMLRYVSRSILQ